MITSNKSVVPLSMHQGKRQLVPSLSDNLSTIEHQKIRNQNRSMNKAFLSGNSTRASDSAKKLHLQQSATRPAIRPLIRNKTARDFENA